MEAPIITLVPVVRAVSVARTQAILPPSLAAPIRCLPHLQAREVVTGTGGREGRAWSEVWEAGRMRRGVAGVLPATHARESRVLNSDAVLIAACKVAAGPVSNFLRHGGNCLAWRATCEFLEPFAEVKAYEKSFKSLKVEAKQLAKW